MSEPTMNVRDRNRAQGLGQGFQQGIKGACLRRPQCGLDFGPAQFNRVEVGRIMAGILPVRLGLIPPERAGQYIRNN